MGTYLLAYFQSALAFDFNHRYVFYTLLLRLLPTYMSDFDYAFELLVILGGSQDRVYSIISAEQLIKVQLDLQVSNKINSGESLPEIAVFHVSHFGFFEYDWGVYMALCSYSKILAQKLFFG